MAKRIQSVIVGDIIGFIDRIDSYTAGLSYQNFSTQFMVVDACMHNIQIIGEAITSLKDETKERASTVPWNLITGMRSRLTNENFEADPEGVWHVIHNALPELKNKMERLHRKLTDRNL